MRVGILPLARPTFDLRFAGERLSAMFRALERAGVEAVGPREAVLDGPGAERATDAILDAQPDRVLVLQATFTDAASVAALSGRTSLPIAIWAPPEPRTGGRLRLNAFCGLNLASHALGRRRRAFSWLYADPAGSGIDTALAELLAGKRTVRPRSGRKSARARRDGMPAPMRIARIGSPPDGFDTCRFEAEALRRRVGAEVAAIELSELFSRARGLPRSALDRMYARAARDLPNLGELDPGEVERSLRLAGGLESIASEGGYDGFAIRCWPEAFTEYGGAVCGPVSLLGEKGVPCACEADVNGAVTQVLLERLSGQPAFLADIVDVDVEDGTGVLWHCGQAPASMADPEFGMRATVHGNRGQALLYEFALRPGRVTLVRLSRTQGEERIVAATGEMLRRPPSFSGTSGVVRFDRPAGAVLGDVMDSGLEHHVALAYGDHLAGAEALAASLGVPFLELGHA